MSRFQTGDHDIPCFISMTIAAAATYDMPDWPLFDFFAENVLHSDDPHVPVTLAHDF